MILKFYDKQIHKFQFKNIVPIWILYSCIQNSPWGMSGCTFVYVFGKVFVKASKLLCHPSCVKYIVVFLSKPILSRNWPTSWAIKQLFFPFVVVPWHLFVPNISVLQSTAMNRPCDSRFKVFSFSSTESTNFCNPACNWRASNTTIHETEFMFFIPSTFVMLGVGKYVSIFRLPFLLNSGSRFAVT